MKLPRPTATRVVPLVGRSEADPSRRRRHEVDGIIRRLMHAVSGDPVAAPAFAATLERTLLRAQELGDAHSASVLRLRA